MGRVKTSSDLGSRLTLGCAKFCCCATETIFPVTRPKRPLNFCADYFAMLGTDAVRAGGRRPEEGPLLGFPPRRRLPRRIPRLPRLLEGRPRRGFVFLDCLLRNLWLFLPVLSETKIEWYTRGNNFTHSSLWALPIIQKCTSVNKCF